MRDLTVNDIPSTTSWGPMSQGLRLSLSLPQTTIRIGDPILATIDLENLGPEREVFLGCNGEEWCGVGIADGAGRLIPRQRVGPVDCYSTSWSSTLKHDSVMEVTVRLDNIFKISDAGSYTVTATSTLHPPYIPHLDANGNQAYDSPILASPVSNTVEITIRAPAPSAESNPTASHVQPHFAEYRLPEIGRPVGIAIGRQIVFAAGAAINGDHSKIDVVLPNGGVLRYVPDETKDKHVDGQTKWD